LVVVTDFKEALEKLSQNEGVAEIFVVGGSSLYDMSMDKYKEYCKLIIATRINKSFECDTFITKNLENHSD
jgi:dihydrofolate reductase